MHAKEGNWSASLFPWHCQDLWSNSMSICKAHYQDLNDQKRRVEEKWESIKKQLWGMWGSDIVIFILTTRWCYRSRCYSMREWAWVNVKEWECVCVCVCVYVYSRVEWWSSWWCWRRWPLSSHWWFSSGARWHAEDCHCLYRRPCTLMRRGKLRHDNNRTFWGLLFNLMKGQIIFRYAWSYWMYVQSYFPVVPGFALCNYIFKSFRRAPNHFWHMVRSDLIIPLWS